MALIITALFMSQNIALILGDQLNLAHSWCGMKWILNVHLFDAGDAAGDIMCRIFFFFFFHYFFSPKKQIIRFLVLAGFFFFFSPPKGSYGGGGGEFCLFCIKKPFSKKEKGFFYLGFKPGEKVFCTFTLDL